MARIVFWCSGSGIVGMVKISSNKIQAKILDLGYGGARRALYTLSPKFARILSAANTIDWWMGAWFDYFPIPPTGVMQSHDNVHSRFG